MLDRRDLLKRGLLGLAGCSLPLSVLAANQRGDADATSWLFSAVDDPQGRHRLAGITSDGRRHFTLPVDERCHGSCRRPGHPEVVIFARRPGRHFYVVNAERQAVTQRIESGPGHHFYGHGVFAPGGRYLYVTANRLEDAAGLVRVYDADRDYAWTQDLPLDGIGPHELRLHPDGETLIVALGGIETHPDYGRAKLNLDDMAPALLLMNRHSGTITARHAPSHHQLSCRHLDVAPDGTVLAGYQFQGPAWEPHPLLCRLTPDGAFDELALDEARTLSLKQYTASVAISRVSPLAAVTAPRGHQVLLLDYRRGRPVAHLSLADAAGARCDGRGGFLISTGGGALYRVTATSAPERLAQLPLHWDNHLG